MSYTFTSLTNNFSMSLTPENTELLIKIAFIICALLWVYQNKTDIRKQAIKDAITEVKAIRDKINQAHK